MNRFSRVPSWLRNALGTTDPNLPDQIETAAVLPVLDIAQGGWGGMRWRLLVGTGLAASSGANTVREIEGDENLTRLMYLHVTHVGGSAAEAIQIQLRDRVMNDPLALAAPSVPAGTTLSHQQIMGSSDPFVIPPGFHLAIRYPATALGESWALRMLEGETKAGFKVT